MITYKFSLADPSTMQMVVVGILDGFKKRIPINDRVLFTLNALPDW